SNMMATIVGIWKRLELPPKVVGMHAWRLLRTRTAPVGNQKNQHATFCGDLAARARASFSPQSSQTRRPRTMRFHDSFGRSIFNKREPETASFLRLRSTDASTSP